MGYVSQTHQGSSTLQEEGLTNEGRHDLLWFHKQVLDKRGITELQHANTNTTRLTAYEVGIYLKEISQLSKIPPPPLNSSPVATLRNVIHTCRAFHRSYIETEHDLKSESWVRLWGTDADIESSLSISFIHFNQCIHKSNHNNY